MFFHSSLARTTAASNRMRKGKLNVVFQAVPPAPADGVERLKPARRFYLWLVTTLPPDGRLSVADSRGCSADIEVPIRQHRNSRDAGKRPMDIVMSGHVLREAPGDQPGLCSGNRFRETPNAKG